MEIFFRLLPTSERTQIETISENENKLMLQKEDRRGLYFFMAMTLFVCIFLAIVKSFAWAFAGFLMMVAYYGILSMFRIDKRKPDEQILFNKTGFQVTHLEQQGFFPYKNLQNLVFCFLDASASKPIKPYFVSWEENDIKHQCFFDSKGIYSEGDFLKLFQYLYKKNIPFSEVNESGEKLNLLRSPSQEKLPEKLEKYQKLIDEIGKKEEE